MQKQKRYPSQAKAQPAVHPAYDESLPLHSEEAEQGALGCAMLLANESRVNCAEIIAQLNPTLFYNLRHTTIWQAMRAILAKGMSPDLLVLREWLKKNKELEVVGGLAYLNECADSIPSAANFAYYLEILKEKAHCRTLRTFAHKILKTMESGEFYPEDLLADVAAMAPGAAGVKPITPLKVWTMNELEKHEPPAHLQLVGDNEIFMGYDGIVVLAGPGSSGKSLAVDALALAGAKGKGEWMGRKIHRKFKTLIIQAENGTRRLKRIQSEFKRNHPELNINEYIFITSPPEGGIPFHRAEFRAAVREAIEKVKPDIIVVDPWSQVATDDASKEIVDKLAEIRSCFPTGDDCPCLLIVAHTKKPRPEDVRKGRALAYLVSGSVALPNTARCVYVLLPWSEDTEDDRIYWVCPKLNNGEMYAPTVWHRRLGTFFEQDTKTDPKSWGKEDEQEEARAISADDLKDAFGDQIHLMKSALAKRLMKGTGCAEQTAYRVISKPKGYLSHLMDTTDEGWLKLKAS